jgi:hypothetical protein
MPSITDRIALEGAPEVNAAFASMFKAGAEAASGLKSAFKDIGLDKDLTPQFDRAKKAAADMGDGFKKTVQSIAGTVNDLTSASAKITGVVTGLAAALFGLSAVASKTAHEIEQGALRTGQASDEFQKTGFGFRQTGVEAGELTRAFAKMSEEANKAAQEGKQSTGAWEKYGIALRGTDGHARSVSAILADVADKIAATTSPTERAGIAAELFGARVGTKMVGLLAQGSAGIRAMAEDAEKLGVVIGEHDLAAGTAFERAMVRLTGTLDATRVKFGLAFAPAFTTAINAFADAFGRLQPAIVSVAETIANTLAPYIKDVAAALTGQAAQIQTGFVQVLYAAFTSLVGLIRGVLVPVIQGWIAIIQQAAAAIDSVFGAGFTAKLASGAVAAVALAVAFGTLLKSVQLLAGGVGILLRLVGLGASLSPVGLAIVVIATAVGLLAVALSKVDWGKFADAAAAAWDGVVVKVQSVVDAIKAPFVRLFEWLKDAIDTAAGWFAKLLGQAQAEGGPIGGAIAGGAIATGAGGGTVSGGTPGRDSVHALLMPGEYVHRTAAVSHYGVGFMNAINSLRLPRYALGGLVEGLRLSLPPLKLAQGGPVPAASIVNLSLDGRRFAGLRAEPATASALRAHALARQTAATGRKPGWYR